MDSVANSAISDEKEEEKVVKNVNSNENKHNETKNDDNQQSSSIRSKRASNYDYNNYRRFEAQGRISYNR